MPYTEISQYILDHQDELADTIVSRQYEQQPELEARYGDTGWEKSIQDTLYHLTYLAEAVRVARLNLFGDYMAWVRVTLEGYGVLIPDVRATLVHMQAVLCEALSADMCEIIEEYIQFGIIQLDQTSTHQTPAIDRRAPHGALAARYLEMVLEGGRHQANQLIMDAVERGVPIKEIYLHVFQPVQYEIGRLWQTNRVSIAQEHYATAVTQLIMSRLYPYIFTTKKNGYTMVATCVGGELHEMGIRMVADFFEMAGWDTFYLGANTPASTIVGTLEQRGAHILAVSATMTKYVFKVEELIRAARASNVGDIRILVGGYPFNISPDMAEQVGADGYAPNAEAALEIAGQLVGI